jgi:hypothetical protein
MRQQLEAPIQRCSQRLMSWHRGTTATLQKFEPIVEICGKLGCSEDVDAGRC